MSYLGSSVIATDEDHSCVAVMLSWNWHGQSPHLAIEVSDYSLDIVRREWNMYHILLDKSVSLELSTVAR